MTARLEDERLSEPTDSELREAHMEGQLVAAEQEAVLLRELLAGLRDSISDYLDALPQPKRLRSTNPAHGHLTEAYAHLGAALMQVAPGDDPIIVEHVRAAHRELEEIMCPRNVAVVTTAYEAMTCEDFHG